MQAPPYMSKVTENCRNKRSFLRMTSTCRSRMVLGLQGQLRQNDIDLPFEKVEKMINLTMNEITKTLSLFDVVTVGGYTFQNKTSGPMIVGAPVWTLSGENGSTLYLVAPTQELTIGITDNVKQLLPQPSFSEPRRPKFRRMVYDE